MISCKRLLLIATCVRVAYLGGTLLLARLLDDYDTSSSLLSESCDDSWPDIVAKTQQQYPWVVWDSVFLHRIATCGYEYEQYFAFFPGMPGLIQLIRNTGLLPGPYAFSIIALLLNNCLFLLSVVLLAKLSQELLQDDRLSATAALVFIASPASIHHSMLYTEALFTATSWLGLYCLYCRGSSLGAALAFAGSAATRSNGLLNAGFLLHEHGMRFLKAWPHSKVSAAGQAVQGAVFSAITAAPYFAYMLFGYRKFCTGVYGGEQQRPWCGKLLPSAYGYVQDVYWNVGFMRYYEIPQIPNFLIASPTLIISLWGALAYACAAPHVILTGGLLAPQQLAHLFSSSSSKQAKVQQDLQNCNGSADASNTGAGTSCAYKRSTASRCSLFPSVVVGRSHYCEGCTSGSSTTDADETAAAAAVADGQLKQQQIIPGVAFQSLRLRQLEVSVSKQRQSIGGVEQQQQQQQQQRVTLQKRSAQEDVLAKQQQKQQQQQQQLVNSIPSTANLGNSCSSRSCGQCSCSSGRAFYSPRVAVFIIHWAFLTLVCLAVMHIQVGTRFLSSCAPLYWFAAALMLHKGALLRWLLWWYCFAFMGLGAAFFTNFLPWT